MSNLTIKEVSELTSIPTHTLRFWEKEFDSILVPLRTPGGQRRDETGRQRSRCRFADRRIPANPYGSRQCRFAGILDRCLLQRQDRRPKTRGGSCP